MSWQLIELTLCQEYTSPSSKVTCRTKFICAQSSHMLKNRAMKLINDKSKAM